MALSAFEGAIRSPALRTIAAHWISIRADQPIPSWSGLRPAEIAPHLPIVWSYHFDRATGEFSGRLAGERIGKHLKTSFKGARLADLHSPETSAWVNRLCFMVATKPALYAYSGDIFEKDGRRFPGERITMPLSSNGQDCDGVLGATDCPHLWGDRALFLPPVPAAERWFLLG